MKRGRFSDEQIIAILKEQEAGMATAEVGRRHGISSATFYKWKAKYGGLEISETRKLRQFEDENARLKRLLADAMLDNWMLKEIGAKKWRRLLPSGRRWPTFRLHSRLANGAPAMFWALTGQWCAMRSGGLTMPTCGNGCATLQQSAAGSAIGACTACWAARVIT